MWNTLLNIVAYWDWFMFRQRPKGSKRVVQLSLSQGALESIIPAIGYVPFVMILSRVPGLNLSQTTKGWILWGGIASIFVLLLLGSERCKQKKAEFENLDKNQIKKYDRYVWVFTLSCVASMVIMLIVLPS